MSERQRLTWGVTPRSAASHPAYPDEGAAHPAYKGDPKADAYENGDPSSWAEDPTHGPYKNVKAPALPNEGAAHPAYKSGSENAALEKLAGRAIRLATAILGDPQGDPRKVAALEDQAFELMSSLGPKGIHAALKRRGEEVDGEEDESDDSEEKPESKKKAADESEEDSDESDDSEEKPESKKKASARLTNVEGRIARIERVLIKLAEEEEKEEEEDEEMEEGKKKANLSLKGRIARIERILIKMAEAEDSDESDDSEEKPESKKKAADESEEDSDESDDSEEKPESKKKAAMSDDDQLEAMLKEEGMWDDNGETEFFPEESDLSFDEEVGPDEMGLDEYDMTEDEANVLSQLYEMPVMASGEKDEDHEEETKKKASSARNGTSGVRPQPRTASAGPRRLGGVTKTDGAKGEVDELSALWKSAPDVSEHF